MNTKNTSTKKKVLLGIGGLIVFFFIIGSVFEPVEPESVKQPANIEAIRTDLNTYATEYLFEESEADRWVDVVVEDNSDGILIRVSTNPEVETNEVAVQLYCDKIGEVLDIHASEHKADADVFIYQFGEVVKTCVF